MLTYHEVMTTDFGKLTTAATAWDGMADKFETLETTYEKKVQSTTTSGVWLGQAQQVAAPNFAVTRNEYNSAQIQARAVAMLLREAATLFTELRGKVKDAVAEAVAAGMKVSEGGVASYDFSKVDAQEARAIRHDPDLAGVERSWTRRIQQAVDAFEEADSGVKLALIDAVTDTNFQDGTFGGFNGSRPYSSLKEAAAAENMPKDRAKVAEWWSKLDPVTRGILLEERGEELKKAGILDAFKYRWKQPDEGAGPFGVEEPTQHDYWILAQAKGVQGGGDVFGQSMASRNMAHYLGATGEPLTLDVDRFLKDEPTFKASIEGNHLGRHQDAWRQQALDAFEKSGGKPVAIPVESRTTSQNLPDGTDWYYAVNGHQQNVSGVVSVTPGTDGKPKVSLDYQVNVWDRYNWDQGKSVNIGPIHIPDTDLQRLHTTGLAQEYDMRGSSSVHHQDLTDGPGPASVPEVDPGREGTRKDPERGREENR
ncbi:hypothetical protein J7E93_20925 [Streptomyces sp. ISL-36]|uniref:hypothetical protein n=1 Tax=Streptomyces sp. ISL-36 TaxID=2819182 RepID=UPI001BE74CB8|nr:hypothetical protein [Streptomyces sp. ISL-36]MBT2442527.1 hypothetical protein [Streptomyces sp. ISL-36]